MPEDVEFLYILIKHFVSIVIWWGGWQSWQVFAAKSGCWCSLARKRIWEWSARDAHYCCVNQLLLFGQNVKIKCWSVSGSRRRRRRPMRQSGETFMRSLSVAGACNTMCTWLRVTNTMCTCALHTGGIGSLSAVSHGRRIPQPRATRQPLSALFIGSPPPGESRATSTWSKSHNRPLTVCWEYQAHHHQHHLMKNELTITNTCWRSSHSALPGESWTTTWWTFVESIAHHH